MCHKHVDSVCVITFTAKRITRESESGREAIISFVLLLPLAKNMDFQCIFFPFVAKIAHKPLHKYTYISNNFLLAFLEGWSL